MKWSEFDLSKIPRKELEKMVRHQLYMMDVMADFNAKHREFWEKRREEIKKSIKAGQKEGLLDDEGRPILAAIKKKYGIS